MVLFHKTIQLLHTNHWEFSLYLYTITCLKSVGFWVNFFYHQMTALHVAASTGRLKIVECLVEGGADINTQNNEEVRDEED